MHLLLCTTNDQSEYLRRFGTLGVLHGHRVSVMFETPDTLTALEYKCKGAKAADGSLDPITGIIMANPRFLHKVLSGLVDFREPTTDKALTLNDYQGSLVSVKGIPTVIINPPEHIMTTSYGAYIFSRFIEKLTDPDGWFPQTEFKWGVASEDTVESIFDSFEEKATLIAIDIETPMPDDERHTINCVSFTAYFAAIHSSYTIVIPFTSLFWLNWIRRFCALPQPKVLQGGTYDAVRLLRFNCPIHNYLFDTLNLFHSYYSELPKDLAFVAAFSLRRIRYWKDDGKSGNLEDYYRYNALDGWGTLNACLSLVLELPAWAKANYVIEFPLVFPCIHCELEGWRVDPERFRLAAEEQKATMVKSLASVRKMLSAPDYNPNSPVQNKKVFNILGCGDLPTTGEKDMKKAEFRHPLTSRVIGDIRAYKKAAKLTGTYFNEAKFWKFKHDTDWRLFYRLNPAGTDTGRLSSSESSWWNGYQIQNIKRGPQVKQYLVADTGWLLAEPDFEQSESRCTFYMAGETTGIEVVESGKDFHCWNAQLFFGFKYEDLWDEKTKKCKTLEAKEIRDEPAKRTNHGANYNMQGPTMLETIGPKAASKMKVLLNLPINMTLAKCCQHCLDVWDRTYPRVKGLFYDTTIKSIELTKKLVSPLGWTRHFFASPKASKHNLNAAVAHGPQNLSVGIINKGFYRIWWESIYGGLRGVVRIKAQIHDSIPFQYRADRADVVERVKELMRLPTRVVGADGVDRTMLIPVGMNYGKERWSELK